MREEMRLEPLTSKGSKKLRSQKFELSREPFDHRSELFAVRKMITKNEAILTVRTMIRGSWALLRGNFQALNKLQLSYQNSYCSKLHPDDNNQKDNPKLI